MHTLMELSSLKLLLLMRINQVRETFSNPLEWQNFLYYLDIAKTGNGDKHGEKGKWKKKKEKKGGTKPNLNPNPISSFISSFLVCSHFSFSPSPSSFLAPPSPFINIVSFSTNSLFCKFITYILLFRAQMVNEVRVDPVETEARK